MIVVQILVDDVLSLEHVPEGLVIQVVLEDVFLMIQVVLIDVQDVLTVQ